MKHRLKYSVLRILLFVFASGLALAANAIARPKALITDYNQIRVNLLEQAEGRQGQHAGYLIDRRPDTYYHSNYSYGNADYPNVSPIPTEGYIEVTLHEPTRTSQNLHIYTQARMNNIYATPTEFRIDGSKDGINWDFGLKTVSIPFSKVDPENNKPGEENFSARFNLPDGYKYLRFICTDNATDSKHFGSFHKFFLAEFQLYESDDDLYQINNDRSLMLTEDRAHKIIDYTDHYKDFEFIHTHGVINETNHNTPGLQNWCDWSKWVGDSWAESEDLKADGIEMPDYSFINKATAPYGRVEVGDRQRTHVTEHTVYAIPGQVTTLYPFSDIYTTTAYHETYSRWYNYRNDKAHPYLDFLHNPASIAVTDENGYLGSIYGANGATDSYDVYIHNVEDYIRFANRVNSGESRLSARQCADLDFQGRSDIPSIGLGMGKDAFRGIYDGGGYAIRNLTIDHPTWDYVGMFGHVGSCIIRNLNVHESCTFIGGFGVGLVGGVTADEYAVKDPPVRVHGGVLLVHNVSTKATVKASGANAGGILGTMIRWNTPFQVFIADCAVLGNITGAKESAAICGYAGSYATITNSYSDATVVGAEGSNYFVRGNVALKNCYDNNKGNNLQGLPSASSNGNLATTMGSEEWDMGGWGYVIPKGIGSERFADKSRGSIATFYCPDSPNDSFETEYIAVDFSQTFKPERHIDFKNKRITEPIIAFRHIFRVENATKLADEVSGSVSNNSAYLARTRRTIRARAGADFQVRFDHPQPKEQDTRTTMFYKDPTGATRRVRKSKIKVTDRYGVEHENLFYQTADYTRPTTRDLPGGEFPDMYDLGKTYQRMLKCDGKNAYGRYTVHLVACDQNGNELKIFGSDKPLVIAEYIVNFVDENGAAMTSEAEMHTDKYAHTRPATLQDLYGDPIAVVNFDQYRLLQNRPNASDYIFDGPEIPQGGGAKAHKYKWSVPWGQSQYAFGYDDPEDYNMYMLADHSAVTPYHAAADWGTMAENFNKGTGRFDRLFYDTEGNERGYFYYANAASDPGVMASLNTNDLCPGSTLFVSAWLCEFSSASEIQNIIFNFKVIEKGTGTEHTIHSFVTGYVPRETIGKWQHVFYQFTPNLSQLNLTSEEIESYQIVLENNCINSDGADYAIDDIRVYVARPRLYATQTMPLCKGEDGTDVKIETPFEVMLATLGVSEASKKEDSETIDCYYTFVDKEKYENALAEGKDGTEAYDMAVVRYDYISGKGDDQTFGHLTFQTHFRSNPQYIDGNSAVTDNAWSDDIEGERYLVINTHPEDKNLVTGKEYIVALFLNEKDGEEIIPDATRFDIGSKCAKSSTFRIHASGVIKIDGVVVPDLDNITVCENQTPVVQINIQSKDNQTGTFADKLENAIVDWWDGSMEEYIDQKDPKSGQLLNEVLSDFRMEYPEATTWDVPAKGDYTEAMREYLRTLCEPDTEEGTPARLLLYRSSFVFHPVKMAPGADKTHVYAVAIPIDIYGNDVTVCTTPSEIRLTVRNDSPWLRHGLSLDYPGWMDDVPLRIGLRQLESVSAENIQDNISGQTKLLSIPVRAVSVVTQSVSALERIPDDPAVYLVETNDPEYIDLNVETVDGQAGGLHAMGALSEIVAQKGDNKNGNVLKMAFDSDFKFKEGHYYRLRFAFRENGVASSPTGDDGDGAPRHCHGQQVFTLKVVPEYQAWVAQTDSTNWNNDKNWRRVSKADLLAADTPADDLDRFVTDGNDTNRSTADSYVPMDFTKVIIPAGVSVPRLYAPAQTQQVTVDGQTYNWPANITAPAGNSSPTDYIIYDMAAKNLAAGIGCRPWYTNTCDQIHFHSNAEILGQNLLSHNRAWVDFEIEPEMWYTLASPISGVVAGDMYLPTVGARQLSQLFTPITFDTGLNDRFAPAVYQRSWNKATATVYELGGSQSGTNVAIRTTWSHVYNDVDESYSTPAAGFSIKADVSKATVAEDLDRVLFRLPKDDDKYLYYDNNSSATGHETTIDRSAGNKLHQSPDGFITATVSAAAPGKYFLVGNPFMAHLDMAAFLSDNSALINPRYWVMNSEGQAVAEYRNGSFETASTMAEPGLVPPLQGFFVEAKEACKELSLTFNSAHTTLRPFDPEKDDNRLRSPELVNPDSPASRSAATAMRITAMRDDQPLSQAVMLLDPNASRAYDEAEDAATLFDSLHGNKTTVYTIAGNMAAAVNALPELTTTELGLDAENGQRTVLHFADTDCLPGALLFDALTGEEMPLYNGMQYEIEGPATARLFIVPAAADRLGNEAIRVQTSGNSLTVTAPDNGLGLTVAIHDMAGRTIHSSATDTNTATLTLQSGIYLLHAQNPGVEPLRTKILIQK